MLWLTRGSEERRRAFFWWANTGWKCTSSLAYYSEDSGSVGSRKLDDFCRRRRCEHVLSLPEPWGWKAACACLVRASKRAKPRGAEGWHRKLRGRRVFKKGLERPVLLSGCSAPGGVGTEGSGSIGSRSPLLENSNNTRNHPANTLKSSLATRLAVL